MEEMALLAEVRAFLVDPVDYRKQIPIKKSGVDYQRLLQ